MDSPPIRRTRVALIGASNLTRGLRAAVAEAWRRCGGPADVFVAAGRGRSFGLAASLFGRVLPGILDCGIWRALEEGTDAGPTPALVTDVGNDLMYAVAPDVLLAWVDETLRRLGEFGGPIALADLPMARLRRVTRREFLVVRGLLFPTRRVTYEDTMRGAEEASAGLATLAAARGATLVPPDPAWYGRDPIHPLRPAFPRLWSTLLAPWGAPPDAVLPRPPWTLHFRPERRRLWGVPLRVAQPMLRRAEGAVWCF